MTQSLWLMALPALHQATTVACHQASRPLKSLTSARAKQVIVLPDIY